ncbi:nucleotide sugar dehydrogenase [Candidatus Bathyarchaeota archaeon]|nr:MAG: nucleotide sugar dehydrogenase [Candidatus Bathyarchaeota archaeon]TMI43991.1 MAG: nucleotide sugar dehydrogenase [Candidatus Bathyarchaeota archaeon]
MSENTTALLDKIMSKKAKVCVVGLGYVGVPLTVASAQAGFDVIGVDMEKEKVSMINKGICYVEDAYSEKYLPDLVRAGLISATNSLPDGATSSDIVIVCVPTPLNPKGDPDLSFLKSVAKDLSKNLSGFKLVIVESTSFPGTTTDIFQPLLQRKGKSPEKDFALVYSPERIDYGNAKFGVRNIPKVVGGINDESTQLGAEFYKAILDAPVVTVGSPSVAEATKMLENIFRYVNIALVNELAILHETLGVDFIEAISAAATKPFGFMPHYPGPGVGGHCIPKDPFYLVFKAKQAGFLLRLVSASKTVNKMMPVHTIDRLAKALRTGKKSLPNAIVVVWGLAYKGEVKDTRRSPSIELLKLLKQSRAKIRVFDPYVPRVIVGGKTYESSSSEIESVRDADALMIATAHNAFRTVDLSKIRSLMRDRPILYDTRNLRTRRECEEAGFTYLATGRP